MLIDNGYDDLDSISRCNQQEAQEIEALFQTPETKKNIKILVESLRQVGIDAYRKQQNEYRRLTAMDPNEPVTIRFPTNNQTQINAINFEAPPAGSPPPAPSDSSDLPPPPPSDTPEPSETTRQIALQLQQAELYLQQAQSQLIAKSSYCAVRSHPEATWSDKYVVLEGTELKWLTSRRDSVPETQFSLLNLLQAVDKPDPTTVVLSLSNETSIELGYDNPQETDEWFAAFASVIPVAQAAIIHHQHLQQLQQQQQIDAYNHQQAMGQSQQQHSSSSSSSSSSAAPRQANQQQQIGMGGGSQIGEQLSQSGLPLFTFDGEEQHFDVNDWNGCIALHSYYRAVVTLTRTVFEPMDPLELERRIIGDRDLSPLMQKLKQNLRALSEGTVFKKYKHGSSSKRMIWCTPLFDYLVWGSEDKMDVKGFISTADITEINQGFGKNKCRLYVVSPGRTLELEAKDGDIAKQWKDLFEMLHASSIAELNAKKKLYLRAGMSNWVNQLCEQNSKLLNEGDVFKKWPSKVGVQKGSETTRKIWSSSNVDRLQWGDIQTQKVMGFLLMNDVIYVQEDAQDKLKFTITAQKRSLDLEAKSQWVREKWVRALRFFVEFKKRN